MGWRWTFRFATPEGTDGRAKRSAVRSGCGQQRIWARDFHRSPVELRERVIGQRLEDLLGRETRRHATGFRPVADKPVVPVEPRALATGMAKDDHRVARTG